jgi:hypothetical protein
MNVRRFTVKLTADEIAEATDIGRQRHALHEATGRVDPVIDERGGLAIDVQGAIAEKAVSVALRRAWDGKFLKLAQWKIWRRLGHDVSGIEVRATAYATGGLPVHDTDPNDHPFVLVVDRASPTFTLAGWIFGKDAKQEKWWNTTEMVKRPCFLVPQDQLRPAWELKKEARQTKRLNRNDPADDFAGHGRYPGMFDSDDGRDAKKVGNVSPARFALPCRRCQTIVPVGALTTWSIRTGWIHGVTAECKAARKSP